MSQHLACISKIRSDDFIVPVVGDFTLIQFHWIVFHDVLISISLLAWTSA